MILPRSDSLILEVADLVVDAVHEMAVALR